MVKVKWDVDGKGVAPNQGGNYVGPDLVKGSYVAKVKRMTIGKISEKSKENGGKPRISVLLEVCGPESAKEYFGHPVWDGLNIIESGRGYVNAFLHALTDGSEAAKSAIEKAFWPPNGPNAKKETNKAGTQTDLHIKKIGKYPIMSPNGEYLVQIVAVPDTYGGKFKAKVDQYLPYTGKQTVKLGSDDDDDIDDDMDDDDNDDLDVDADDDEDFDDNATDEDLF